MTPEEHPEEEQFELEEWEKWLRKQLFPLIPNDYEKRLARAIWQAATERAVGIVRDIVACYCDHVHPEDLPCDTCRAEAKIRGE